VDNADQGAHRHALHRRAHSVGIKVLGPDLGEIEKIGARLETLLRSVPGTRSVLPNGWPGATSSISI